MTAHKLFSCVLRTMRLFSFVYIATPKIFRIILSALFISLEIVLLALSSVKWSVLAHLKSQPRGQNFQAQKPVEHSSPHYTRANKNTKNTFKKNQTFITTILLNLIQCGLERSTRFGLENFAHKIRI